MLEINESTGEALDAAPPSTCDLAVVGGGIVGLAVARELASRRPGDSVAVLEREGRLASHQTRRNSGVVHAGIYYAPGSLKARLCVAGAAELYAYCEARGIPHRKVGKLIVARDSSEVAALGDLERRGHENGVPGLLRLGPGEIASVEPHCRGAAALHSPETGIVDFAAVAHSFAADVREAGGAVAGGAGIGGIEAGAGRIVLRHTRGVTEAGFAVFCAGAWSDRLAAMAGADPDPRIVPFRGAYLRLRPERRELVRGLIYPVPDPSLPFLGVHLTPHMDGEVSLGPTALLAPARDAYRFRDARAGDLASTLAWPGTWRMTRRWWRTGISEIRRAASRRVLAREAAAYVPALRPSDFSPYFAGVRAQALGRDGSLVDDFVVHETERAIHIRNAPSPAATSSLAIARMIADQAEPHLS